MPERSRTSTPDEYPTVTPYLIVQDAPALVAFAVRAFDGHERLRSIGAAGGVHAEVTIGDSVVMIGGGAPDVPWQGRSMPTAIHLYVQDVDAVFARAVDAGATPTYKPTDHEYGERSGGLRDAEGNHWYVATAQGASHVPAGLRTVNAYLHPRRADPVLAFIERALGGTTTEKHATADGVVRHARVRVGDSVIEMGEAHGPYQPMPTMFVVSVEDADAAHRRALDAGARSLAEPADQAFGRRMGGVEDPFGNQWFLAGRARSG